MRGHTRMHYITLNEGKLLIFWDPFFIVVCPSTMLLLPSLPPPVFLLHPVEVENRAIFNRSPILLELTEAEPGEISIPLFSRSLLFASVGLLAVQTSRDQPSPPTLCNPLQPGPVDHPQWTSSGPPSVDQQWTTPRPIFNSIVGKSQSLQASRAILKAPLKLKLT